MPVSRLVQLQEIDWLAPAFALYLEGAMIAGGSSPERLDLTQSLISATFDHSLTLVNELAIKIANPDDRYTDDPLFAPGNEIELHLGYGTDLQFVGRGTISRHLPDWPEDGADTIEIKALDPSHRLMREEGEIQSSPKANTKKASSRSGQPHGIYDLPTHAGGGGLFGIGKTPKAHHRRVTSGRVWSGTLGVILRAILQPYGITLDIDSDLAKIHESFPQKKGSSDYDVLRQLANLYQAEFFVEWDPHVPHRGNAAAVAKIESTGRWVARFRKSREFAGQESKIIFRRGGSSPTLINCQLSFAVDESVNEIEVLIYDRKMRGWKAINVEEKPTGAKTIRYGRKVVAKGGPQGPVQAGEDLPPIGNMSELRISVEGHGIDVRVPRKFRSAADALRWAEQWIQAYKTAFIVASGTVIGVPDLRSGQTHQIEGIGKRFSGDYYFTQVKHVYGENGYRCEYTANKVIT